MYAVVDPKAASLPRPLTRNGRPISMRPTSGRNLETSMFDSPRDTCVDVSGGRNGDGLTTISCVIQLSFTIVKYHCRQSLSIRPNLSQQSRPARQITSKG